MTLFSRLRAFARSRSTPETSLPTTIHEDEINTTQPFTISRNGAAPVLGAKIYPDINALLAEVEEDVLEEEPSSQMWMSSDQTIEGWVENLASRTAYSDASGVDQMREDESRAEEPILQTVARQLDEGMDSEVESVAERSPSGSQRGWPTFGRERGRVVLPDLGVFGQSPSRHGHSSIGGRMEDGSTEHIGRQSSSCTRLDVVYRQESPSSASRPTTRSSWTYRRKSTTLSRRSSDRRPSPPRSLPANCSSSAFPSPSLSRAPSDTRRNQSQVELAAEMPKAPRRDENTPLGSAQQKVFLYSPQAPTFGFPSPVSRPLSTTHSPDASSFLTPASPPPLHSTPNNARSSDADAGVFEFNPPPSGPNRKFRFRGSDRQRQLTLGVASSTQQSLGLPPSSSTFGKDSRTRALSDRPKASKIFSDNDNTGTMHWEAHPEETSRMQPLANSTNLKLRARSDPPKHRSYRRSAKRRRSAEWRSQTAAMGVTASSKDAGSFGWPADVSREILKLSLGEPTMKSPSTSTRDVAQIAHVKTSSVSSRRGPTGLQPTAHMEALYLAPRMEGDSQYNTFPTSRRQSQMRTEGPPGLSFSFPILPSPSSSPSTARPAPNAGLASVPAEPWVSQSGPRHLSPSQAVGSKISGTRGLVSGRTDETGVVTQSQIEGSESESGTMHHVRSTSDSNIRWSSKKMQDLLDRAEVESGEDGVRAETSIALPPKETLRLVPSSSSKDQLVSTRPLSGTSGALRPASFEAPLATSTPSKSDKSKGKRKADEAEENSPPKSEGRKSSFASHPMHGPRVSNASHAPSSYLSQKSRKRVRLSSPHPSPSHSRRGSISNGNSQGFGTWSSRNSSRTNASSSMQQTSTSSPHRPASRASHARSASVTTPVGRQQTRRSMSVMSQSSIPISAIIAPHPPSIDRLSNFHVRDPHRPPPKRPVGWTLRLQTSDDHGSPKHAWCFWVGFFLPILWFIASIWPIPKTRILDAEKSIPVDDPNVEHENRVWRTRCRFASAVFFITYVPVIVLLAIFA